jgi:hypothetical protein
MVEEATSDCSSLMLFGPRDDAFVATARELEFDWKGEVGALAWFDDALPVFLLPDRAVILFFLATR